MDRGGAAWLQRACLEAALALVSPFFGRSWVWGTFPRCAAAGGFSMVSPLSKMYVAGSKEEKRAGGPLHGATLAQSFAFCKGRRRGWGRHDDSQSARVIA